jgi:hypothetical protein
LTNEFIWLIHYQPGNPASYGVANLRLEEEDWDAEKSDLLGGLCNASRRQKCQGYLRLGSSTVCLRQSRNAGSILLALKPVERLAQSRYFPNNDEHRGFSARLRHLSGYGVERP